MANFQYPLIWGMSPVTVKGQPSGDTLRWTPTGLIQTALDIPDEPLRTYSWYGVRGSKKYPFGRAWNDAWQIDGWNLGQTNQSIYSFFEVMFPFIIGVIFGFMICKLGPNAMKFIKSEKTQARSKNKKRR